MANDKAKREQVAKHEWIDQNGKVVKSIYDAAGTRYTLLENDESVDMLVSDLPNETLVMAAAFGIRTRATNMSSTARNANDGDADAQISAVKEFWDMLVDGEWGEGRTGGTPIFLLAQASMRAQPEGGQSEDRLKRVKQWLRNKTDEERAAHAARDQIVVAIAEIRAERAAARAKELRARAGNAGSQALDIPV
jgi:hypothetical protein